MLRWGYFDHWIKWNWTTDSSYNSHHTVQGTYLALFAGWLFSQAYHTCWLLQFDKLAVLPRGLCRSHFMMLCIMWEVWHLWVEDPASPVGSCLAVQGVLSFVLISLTQYLWLLWWSCSVPSYVQNAEWRTYHRSNSVPVMKSIMCNI